MTGTAQNILKTLAYFDLFSYPLNEVEIYQFNTVAGISQEAVKDELEILVKDKAIFKSGDLFSLHNNTGLAERRHNGNRLAATQMIKARRVAKFLSKFPYVKAVAVSGSLSKNFATENSDIDFFIITTANRLWIARTCMHLYKKLTFLTGRQHWFCMNYYVDEMAMEIKEKNVFTAMEIVTLIPMHGKDSMDEFMKQNNWTASFFPLKQFDNTATVAPGKGLLSRLIEKIFAGKTGDYTDIRLMNITDKRWRKKAERCQLNSWGRHLGMSSNRHFSKPDPKNFQEKVVKAYNERVECILASKQFSMPVLV